MCEFPALKSGFVFLSSRVQTCGVGAAASRPTSIATKALKRCLFWGDSLCAWGCLCRSLLNGIQANLNLQHSGYVVRRKFGSCRFGSCIIR